MPRIYATDEVVNGHEWVNAALDDPFWVGEKGYAPRDEEGEEPEPSPAPEPPDKPLSDLSRDELLELAGDQEIEGSGKGGYVTVKDLIEALGG